MIIRYVSGGLSLILLLMVMVDTPRLCSEGDTACSMFVFNLAVNLLPAVPLFLFSLATSLLRQEVVLLWFKFAVPWTAASMLAILAAPRYASDWMFPIEKGTVAMFFMAIFVIVSIVIIARGYWSRRV